MMPDPCDDVGHVAARGQKAAAARVPGTGSGEVSGDERRRGAGETCDIWRLNRDNLWEPVGSVPCEFRPAPAGDATAMLRLPATVAVTGRTRIVSHYGTFHPTRYPPVPDGHGYQVVLVVREGARESE